MTGLVGSTVAGTVTDCTGGGSSTAAGSKAVACGYKDIASGNASSAFGFGNSATYADSNAIRLWQQCDCRKRHRNRTGQCRIRSGRQCVWNAQRRVRQP